MQPDNAKRTRRTLRLILLNVCIGQTVVGLDQRVGKGNIVMVMLRMAL